MKINSKIKLNTGNEIYQFGLGVWRSEEATKDAVLAALKFAYRQLLL